MSAEPTERPAAPGTGSLAQTPAPRRFYAEIPLALVVCGVGLGLLVIALHHFRWGVVAISISLLGGALLRLVLPTRPAGLLAVRSRFTDVATMSLVGGALLVLALVTRT